MHSLIHGFGTAQGDSAAASNKAGHFALKVAPPDLGSHTFTRPRGCEAGNAQVGALQTVYDGPRPAHYSPMKKQGAIILGIGGDNSDGAIGGGLGGGGLGGERRSPTPVVSRARNISSSLYAAAGR